MSNSKLIEAEAAGLYLTNAERAELTRIRSAMKRGQSRKKLSEDSKARMEKQCLSDHIKKKA